MPGQLPYPSEPAPVIHANTTMGMPVYGQPPYQQPLPNQAIHANSTLAMPLGASQFAMPTAPGQSEMDYRVANAARLSNEAKSKKAQDKEDDEDKEEINVLAVVIFGSLSVTALGGLGMLILLMFAT